MRSLFHLRLRAIFGGMGSYPRREKAAQKARERADTVPALDCQSCGALTPGERFRYYADQIICDACDERNPQSRRRLVPRALLQPREHIGELRGGAAVSRHRLWPSITVLCSALSYISRARRRCADCSPISALRPSSSPTSTTATGDGVRALSRSHFSRAARTCSESTIAALNRNGLRPFTWLSHPSTQPYINSTTSIARDTFQLGRPEKMLPMKHDTMEVPPPKQFCPVKGCKTDRPHTDDPVVRAQRKYLDTPVVIARQAWIGMTQLRDSMQDDLKGNRSFAILTRIRQVEELFYRTIFCLFAATPEEIPHFLSEAPPNSFDSIFKKVNKRLCDGRLTLDTHVVQGDGLPDEGLWSVMNKTSHVSMRALQMAHDFMDSALQKRLIDNIVQRHVLVLTRVLNALEHGDSREQILKTLVVG